MSSPGAPDGSGDPASRADEALWPLERGLRDRYRWIVLILLGLLLLNELARAGLDLGRWDWLWVSGVIVFFAAIRSSLDLPERVHDTLRRLADRAILGGTREELAEFEHRLHRSARRATLPWAALTVSVLLWAWVAATGGRFWAYAPTALLEAAAAGVVGPFIGRTVTYARLGRALARSGLPLRAEPEHLDGAAGLRPVGALYFFQASLLAVPAAYLALWWLLIPVVGGYDGWRQPYALLLAFVLGCELLAFAAPMWSFHVVMRDRKRQLLADADELSRRIDEARRRLYETPAAEGGELSEQLDRLAQRYHAIEEMPTWPMDARLRRRFALNNLLLLVPVVTQVLDAPATLRQLLDGLGRAFSG